MFWGAVLKENKPYVFTKEKANKVFHLSSASLDDSVEAKPVYIHIESKGAKYIACVLRKDVNETMKLDNYMTVEEGLQITVSNCPKGEVHLTGYYEFEANIGEHEQRGVVGHHVENTKKIQPVVNNNKQNDAKKEKKNDHSGAPEAKKHVQAEKKPEVVEKKNNHEEKKPAVEKKPNQETKKPVAADRKNSQEEKKVAHGKVIPEEKKTTEAANKGKQPAAKEADKNKKNANLNPNKKTAAELNGDDSEDELDEEDDLSGELEEGENMDDEDDDDEDLFKDAEIDDDDDDDDEKELRQFLNKKQANPATNTKKPEGKPQNAGKGGEAKEKPQGNKAGAGGNNKHFEKGGNKNFGANKA